MNYKISACLINFISFFMLIICINFSYITPAYSADTISLKTPPDSLRQWYKPSNKRQVWLHTMFKLRREMQAISLYASTNNKTAVKKWIQRLDKNYNKIADMVPEWEKKIKPRLIDELKIFANKGDAYRIAKTLKMISRTCDDCHYDYQPLVTAIYRSPYYADIKIKGIDGKTQTFEENMEQLSTSVNLTLIALDDGQTSAALQASKILAKQLHNLGNSCNNCHKDDIYPHERILGKPTQQLFEKLQTNISKGRIKDSQKLMGEIAVSVCARCHNTHRIISNLRNTLIPDEQ